MAFDMSKFVERFNEAVGKDSQEEIASKLHMTQGNVSKITTGKQLPKLDTIYLIAEAYDVSVDWILGLSDIKKRPVLIKSLSYAELVEILLEAERPCGTISEDTGKRQIQFNSEDPLLYMLLKKAKTLRDADTEMFENWKETKLSLFSDKPILWRGTWEEEPICYLVDEASTETHWLAVYEEAKAKEAELDEIMRPDPGPFDNM